MMGQVQQRGKQQRKSQKNMHYRRYNDRQQVRREIIYNLTLFRLKGRNGVSLRFLVFNF